MNVIIGGGPAGRAAALELAALREDNILVEKNQIGGTCLNQGCMVVCGLNDMARLLYEAKILKKHGIIEFDYVLNYRNIIKGIKKTLTKIRKVIEKETKDAGIEIIYGEAEVIDNEQVKVGDEKISYENLIIATGARPFTPPIKGTENAINYQNLLELENTPESLVIIGSGTIAAEIANVFSILGSDVHLICRGEFLSRIDDEIRDYIIQRVLKDVNIYRNTKTNEINEDGVVTEKGYIEGLPFLATGMTPNSELVRDLVKKGKRGNIIVNDKMETSCKNIYAAGDVIGGIGTTPVARMEGAVAGLNAAGIEKRMDYRHIPHAISLIHDVGFIEDGDSKGKNPVEGKIPGAAGPGSFWKVLEDNTGFSKVQVDLETGEIGKLYSISPSSRNIIAYMAFLLKLGVKTYDFENFMETHPSTDVIYKLMRFFAKY